MGCAPGLRFLGAWFRGRSVSSGLQKSRGTRCIISDCYDRTLRVADSMYTWMFVVLFATGQFAQSNTGELHLTVFDPSGLGLQSHVELVSEANQFREQIETDAQGTLTVKRLSFGAYRVAIMRDGFAPFA